MPVLDFNPWFPRAALDFNYGNLVVGDASASLMCRPPWQLFRRPAAADVAAASDVVKIQSMGS